LIATDMKSIALKMRKIQKAIKTHEHQRYWDKIKDNLCKCIGRKYEKKQSWLEFMSVLSSLKDELVSTKEKYMMLQKVIGKV
jgi:hypothetical protein